jgi:hypothetical protein
MGEPKLVQRAGHAVAGHDPLEYWLEQERQSCPGGAEHPARGSDPAPMQGGWWLLPVMVMALPIWSLIIWLVVRS